MQRYHSTSFGQRPGERSERAHLFAHRRSRAGFHALLALLALNGCADGLSASGPVSTGGAISSGIAAQIDAPVVSSPLGNPGSLCSKATACSTLITERAFDCLMPAQCESDWDFAGNFQIVQDSTAPVSSPNVGQITYAAGFVGGSGAANVYPRSFSYRTLHVSIWIRFSENFQSHATGINKIMHFFVNGLNRVFLQANGADLALAFGVQQLAAPFDVGNGQVGTAAILPPNASSQLTTFTRGQWHRVDLILVANTPGVANGSVMAFLDGRKVNSYHGLMFVESGGNGFWEGMNWNPTWGGTGDTVNQKMSMQIDHLILRGRN